MNDKRDILLNECLFKATRSGGPGGQHVNKVSTKAELYWNLDDSIAFSEEEKRLLKQKLSNKLNVKNQLHLSSDSSRSLLTNKEHVFEKLILLLSKEIIKPKKRKLTKVSKARKAVNKEKKIKESKKKKLRSEGRQKFY